MFKEKDRSKNDKKEENQKADNLTEIGFKNYNKIKSQFFKEPNQNHV